MPREHRISSVRAPTVIVCGVSAAALPFALLSFTGFLAIGALFAQDTVFRAETNLRQLEIRVVDNQGRALTGLTAESFALSIDSKSVEIATLDFIERPATIVSNEGARSVEKRAGATQLRTEAAAGQNASETRVLILPEVSRETATAVYESVKRFLSEPWPTGTLVALEGTPFTHDRERLLKALDVKFGGTSLIDVGTIGDQFSAEVMEDWKAELIRNGIDPAPYMPQTFGATLLRTKLRAYRYRDIVRQLSAYPGKKVIVLYREGLPMEPSSQAWWRELAAEAIQHRVSFYTVDSRGLLGSGAGANRQRPTAPPPIISASNTTEGRSLSLREASEGRILAQDDGRHGIRQLAATTGGRSAVNSNDLGQVFEDLRTDLSGYYLLGYYLREDPRTPGKTHRIKVKVKRPRARVRALAGYSDPQPFAKWTKTERFGHLYQAIAGEVEYRNLEAAVGFEIFADEHGNGRLYFDVGGMLGDFELGWSKKIVVAVF